MLSPPGQYSFTNVPAGTWYLLAHSVSGQPDAVVHRRITVTTEGPIVAQPESIATVDVHLKPASQLDPHVLLTLLDARTAALKRASAADGAIAA